MIDSRPVFVDSIVIIAFIFLFGLSFNSNYVPSIQGVTRLVAATSTWKGRDGAGLLSLKGNLYLLGGWNPNPSGFPAPGKTTNEFLVSRDNGISWKKLPTPPWESRHMAGWQVFKDKIWVIGGDNNSGHYQTDVWSWSPKTGDWELATANALPLSRGRVLHQTFAFDGKLWIVGGQTLDQLITDGKKANRESPYYTDAWNSTDGKNWNLVSKDGLWAPRASIIGNAVFDGRMYLIGGGAYDTQGHNREHYNDVWSTTDFKSVTQDMTTSPWSARMYLNVISAGGELWVFAGHDGKNTAEAWRWSEAGWLQVEVPWEARHAASAVYHNGEIYLLGGPTGNTAVWAMK